MLIGIDTMPCSLSLRDRSMFNYEMTLKQIALKTFFIQKSIFVDIFLLSIPIEFWESTWAFFRQSDGYVLALSF